jgi:hypothetical protein
MSYNNTAELKAAIEQLEEQKDEATRFDSAFHATKEKLGAALNQICF